MKVSKAVKSKSTSADRLIGKIRFGSEVPEGTLGYYDQNGCRGLVVSTGYTWRGLHGTYNVACLVVAGADNEIPVIKEV